MKDTARLKKTCFVGKYIIVLTFKMYFMKKKTFIHSSHKLFRVNIYYYILHIGYYK